MSLKRYILLVVGEKNGRLAKCAPALKDYNFSVVQVPKLSQALEFLSSSARLSLVAIEDEVGVEKVREFLHQAKTLQPNLPILWAQDDSSKQYSFSDYAPDGFLANPPQPSDFHRQATKLLREQFYSQALTQRLSEAVEASLRESFDTHVFGMEPFLKSTQVLAGELSSMIYFCGKGVSGHLLVSAMKGHLEKLYQRILPKQTQVSVEASTDLLGELCNSILGRLKSYFESCGILFTGGTPILLQGDNIIVSRTAGSPSLGIFFEEPQGTIFVEFCLDRYDPTVELPAETEFLESGSVHFL